MSHDSKKPAYVSAPSHIPHTPLGEHGQAVVSANIEEVAKKFFLQARFLVAAAVLVLGIGGVGTYQYVQQSSRNKPVVTETQPSQNTAPTEKQEAKTAEEAQTEAAPAATSTPKTTTTPKKTTTTTTTTTPTATPAPAPAWSNTTNCLPQYPSTYQQTYKTMNNMGYLATNSYSNTTKMKAAIEFAGLTTQANAKYAVVLTPNDYSFDNKLTATQWAWMNASPANMKSVLGWHITTECITYDGVNPTKGKTGTMSVQTVNGTITYSAGGIGKFESANVAIWDWFTSNGSVTFMSDFVKKPSIP